MLMIDTPHAHIMLCCLSQPYVWWVEDEQGKAMVEVERKTPKVLNDYTLAQPGVDRHNRGVHSH